MQSPIALVSRSTGAVPRGSVSKGKLSRSRAREPHAPMSGGGGGDDCEDDDGDDSAHAQRPAAKKLRRSFFPLANKISARIRQRIPSLSRLTQELEGTLRAQSWFSRVNEVSAPMHAHAR